MSLDSLPDVFLVLSALMPGFIYTGVLSCFVPLRQIRYKETLLLRFLTATAFNYAICAPLIYLLVAGTFFEQHRAGQAASWFAIIFLVPVVLGVAHAEIIQNNLLGWLYRRLKLRSISPIPTGWDWTFGTTTACFVLITLNDGTEIAGYFGEQSMASSDLDHRDIFVEKVYTVPPSGDPWEPVPGSLGMYVDGAKIAYIEFKDPSWPLPSEKPPSTP